jgi:predicted nucleic acid-binding protein
VVVLDSSFVVAFHNSRDVHHLAAAEAMDRLVGGEWGRALLLEYVFLETVTVLLARRGLETATHVGGVLLDAHEVDFVPCSGMFLEILETFRAQSGRALSFTDAAIVTVARGIEGTTYVATFDRGLRDVEGISVVPYE